MVMRFYKMELNLLKLMGLLIIAFYCQISSATEFEPMDHLQNLAKEFTIKNTQVDPDETVNVVVSPTSAELAKCTNPIEATLPENANHNQLNGIELSCNGTTGWKTLVPVKVEIYTRVVVARQTILPRQTIADEDLEMATYDKNELLSSFYKSKDEVVGQTASHLLTPGTVLTKKNLQAAVLIHKNEIVTITAKNNMVSVSMQGIAKSDGALNEAIKVYNPSSKRTLDAIVAGPDRAEIV
jgi:flagella basal body P-ring formation protein FlgA